MSAFALLNIGSRSMTASYTALQTTGHNIANAGVQGYSRQTVNVATAGGVNTGAGYIGRGVDVQSVTRAHDVYLTREAAATQSVAAMDASRMDALRRLEEVFTPGELGIGHAAGQFLNSMVDLASRPTDDATRQVVLARASEVADRFANASQRMDAIQDDVESALGDAVRRVNALAESIAQVNLQVIGMRGDTQAPLDLLDQRDQLIAELSGKLSLSTVMGDDGAVSVFVAGGRPLVMGGQIRELSVMADPDDPRRSALAMQEGDASRLIETAFLAGGEMAGLLRFQNEDLARGRALLGQMASALTGVVNAQQSFGLDLNGEVGGDLFLDFHDTAVDGALATVIPAASNPGDEVPTLTVTDPTRLQAEEYTLAFEDGGWKLRSSFAGEQINAEDADAVALLGFSLDLPAGLNAADRFLLQPVTYAAGLMRRVLDVPAGIAAASPAIVDGSPDNQGTASVAALRVTASEHALRVLDPSDPPRLTLTFQSNGTFDVNVEGQADFPDGIPATVAWVPGVPMAIGGVELTLNGRPAEGDVFTISPTTQPRQNNTNALAMVALRETTFVGRSGAGEGGSTITDAYAAAMADVGVRVQGAVTSAEISKAVADQAEMRRAADAGVNLDEEAARLLQFQQAYQASAKVLQVAQAVFDTLLQAAG